MDVQEMLQRLEDTVRFGKKELHLHQSELDDESMVALASNELLIHVKQLHLFDNSIGVRGALALAESPYLVNLEVLDFSANHVGDEGGIALASSENFLHLRDLDLADTHIGNESLAALASSESLVNLEALNFHGNFITDEGVIALAKSNHLVNLQRLDLSYNDVDDEGVVALVSSGCLPRLQELHLDYTIVSCGGVLALATSEQAKSLQVISLMDNGFVDKHAITFAHSPALMNLRELYLRSSRIGSEGIRALEQSAFLANMHTYYCHEALERPDPKSLHCKPWDESAPLHHRTMVLARMMDEKLDVFVVPYLLSMLEGGNEDALTLWTLRLLEAWDCGARCVDVLENLSYEREVWEELRVELLGSVEENREEFGRNHLELEAVLFEK